MAEHVDEEIVLDSSRNVAKEMSDKTNKVRTCTRCGQATKGLDGPCGLRCTNILASPELLRHAPEQGEDMLLNLTPVRDTREEEEVSADSPAHDPKPMEKVKVDEDGERFKTKEGRKNTLISLGNMSSVQLLISLTMRWFVTSATRSF